MTVDPFLREPESRGDPSLEHRRGAEALTARAQPFGSREILAREGEDPKSVDVVIEDRACGPCRSERASAAGHVAVVRKGQ